MSLRFGSLTRPAEPRTNGSMAKIRSIRTTRVRMEHVTNRLKARLGNNSVGGHSWQSHGYVRCKKIHPAYVKSLLSSMRSNYTDFEFDQVNYKDCVVVRFRTVGSSGWYEQG